MIVHFLPLPNQKSRNGNSKKLLQQSLPAIYGFIVESLSAFCFLYKLCTFHQKSFSKTFSRSFFSFTIHSLCDREKRKAFFLLFEPPIFHFIVHEAKILVTSFHWKEKWNRFSYSKNINQQFCVSLKCINFSLLILAAAIKIFHLILCPRTFHHPSLSINYYVWAQPIFE